MIAIDALLAIARARLEDAKVLYANDRIASAAYLCGYAVELSLKARICKTLLWAGFPETRGEFAEYASFKTHKLEVLLHLSGQEQRVKAENLREWSTVERWEPDVRYQPIDQADAIRIALMLSSVETLLDVL